MFEPPRVAGLPPRSLLFVETDHGFNLAYNPWDPEALLVARLRGDALDRAAWEAALRPPAYRYIFPIPRDGAALSDVRVVPLHFDAGRIDVIEAESLWPAISQRAGFALPEHASGTCVSGGRFLAIHHAEPGTSTPASVTLSLPAPLLLGRSLAPRVALIGRVSGEIQLHADGALVHSWRVEPLQTHENPLAPRCLTLEPRVALPSVDSHSIMRQRVISVTLVRDPGGDPADRMALDRFDVVEREKH
jgi:hypothetical protein